MLLDKLLNRKLKEQICQPNCTLIVGQKRSGKSTLFSLITQEYIRLGYKVFCSYPCENAFLIPMVRLTDKKTGREFPCIDKDWLYDTDLTNCVVLIDEAATIWPAREYSTTWTSRDTEWFTMLGHYKTVVFLTVQYWDLIDVNVKRSCDEIWFLTKNRFFKGITDIDMSSSITLKVADKNTEIVGKFGRQGAMAVKWQLCEIPLSNCHFYRKPYYKYFSSEFSYKIKNEKQPQDMIEWDNVYDFEHKQIKLN